MLTASRRWPLLLLTTVALAPPLGAAEGESALTDLSLEQLLKVRVTSVSRDAERLQDAPAAVFVISADDIRRTGAATVPEALRLAPGVEVARLGGGRWAVSVRGFNGRFANKLLVMVDGRTIYTPVFSGVVWENFPVTMGDIERIEVLRGPASALWGANAVNGVINVITRPAGDMAGSRVSAGAASRGEASLEWRDGRSPAEATRLRVSGLLAHGPTTTLRDGSDAQDASRDARLILRADHALAQGDQLQLSASLSSHRSADGYPLPLIADGPAARLRLQDQIDELAAMARYEQAMRHGGVRRLQLSLALEHFEFQDLARERRATVDLDWQDALPAMGPHQLVYGADLRYSADLIDATSPLLTVLPGRDTLR